MDKPCDHHKNCGDCFGPNFVRTLETTIENLAKNLAEATEWNLATLEELCLLKGSSKSRKDRQISICIKMAYMCESVFDKINWGYGGHQHFPRLARLREDRLKGLSNGGSDSLDAAIRKYAENLKP